MCGEGLRGHTTSHEYNLTPGQVYTLVWVYQNNGSIINQNATAWIDDVKALVGVPPNYIENFDEDPFESGSMGRAHPVLDDDYYGGEYGTPDSDNEDEDLVYFEHVDGRGGAVYLSMAMYTDPDNTELPPDPDTWWRTIPGIQKEVTVLAGGGSV